MITEVSSWMKLDKKKIIKTMAVVVVTTKRRQ
jgi:hypothetical protein